MDGLSSLAQRLRPAERYSEPPVSHPASSSRLAHAAATARAEHAQSTNLSSQCFECGWKLLWQLDGGRAQPGGQLADGGRHAFGGVHRRIGLRIDRVEAQNLLLAVQDRVDAPDQPIPIQDGHDVVAELALRRVLVD